MIEQGKNKFEGSNDLNSLALFEERKEYKEFVSIPNSIDTWYKNPLYGKIDKRRNSILLSESNLKQLSTENKTLFAIDFVVDAFNDLCKYYNQLFYRKRLSSQNTILRNLEPKRAWISVDQLFHTHMEFIYNLFVSSYLIGTKKEENVKDIESFMSEYLFFIGLMKKLPFTKYEFILSNFCSSFISGLMIDLIVEDNCSVDRMKQKIMEDPNFKVFNKTVKRFGFLLDKNAPWRLVANLNSKIMQEYAKKYGLSPGGSFIKDFLDSYYYDTLLQDIEIFKKYIIHFYNSFVAAYPNLRSEVCKNGRFVLETTKRKLVNDVTDASFWFKNYIVLRLLKSEKKMEEADKENILRKTIGFKTYGDEVKALNYLSNQIN